MNNKFCTSIFIIVLAMILDIGLASATSVELVSPTKLPTQLHENDDVNFTIKISDYSGVKNIVLQTNLVLSGNKPLFDFGDSNQFISGNRYQQPLTLDLSTIKQEILTVNVYGKAPSGETTSTIAGSNVVISKFEDTKLKFYEVDADGKLSKIESFDLIIKKKEDFEKIMTDIRISAFDGMKNQVRMLFGEGLTTEAQNLANEMDKIKMPNSLTLFGFIKVQSDLMLNIIGVGLIIIFFIIGYALGSRGENEEE